MRQVLDLVSVGCLVVVVDQSYNGHVVSKFNNGVCGVDGFAVVRKGLRTHP